MKFKKTQLIALSLFLGASFTLSAEEGLFRPRASLGYASYELDFTGQGGAAIAESTYLVGGFGATMAKENLYFDVAYTTSLGGSYDNVGTDDDFERTDLSLTVGLALDGGFSIFAGYKTGETTFSNYFNIDEKMRFEADGVFFGAGIASSPTEDSTLSFNLSVAILEGRLTDDDLPGVAYDATADTFGLSAGVGYNYYMGDSAGFGLKGTLQSYNFVDWIDPVYVIDDTSETLFAVEASYFVNF